MEAAPVPPPRTKHLRAKAVRAKLLRAQAMSPTFNQDVEQQLQYNGATTEMQPRNLSVIQQVLTPDAYVEQREEAGDDSKPLVTQLSETCNPTGSNGEGKVSVDPWPGIEEEMTLNVVSTNEASVQVRSSTAIEELLTNKLYECADRVSELINVIKAKDKEITSLRSELEAEASRKPTPPSKKNIKRINQRRAAGVTPISGNVIWFNVSRGYGYIKRNDNPEGVYVHYSGIAKDDSKKSQRSLRKGENVVFNLVKGRKGPKACNVTGPDGAAVKGSAYARDRQAIKGGLQFGTFLNRSTFIGPQGIDNECYGDRSTASLASDTSRGSEGSEMDGFEEQFSDEEPWFDAEDYQDGRDQKAINSPTLANNFPIVANNSPTLANNSPTLANNCPTLASNSPTLASTTTTQENLNSIEERRKQKSTMIQIRPEDIAEILGLQEKRRTFGRETLTPYELFRSTINVASFLSAESNAQVTGPDMMY